MFSYKCSHCKHAFAEYTPQIACPICHYPLKRRDKVEKVKK